MSTALQLARAQQDGWRSVVLRRLGQVALNRGDVAAAHDALTESLGVARDWGTPGWSIAPTLAHLANLAVAKVSPTVPCVWRGPPSRYGRNTMRACR